MITKISVVIPAHNVAEYLEQCLDSIKDQTFRDFEVLIMENMSTDDTKRIAFSYSEKDPRFKTFVLDRPGASHARNEGTRLASGKYVAYADGDDFVEPDYLLKLFEAAESSSADMTICPYKCYYNDKKIKPSSFAYKNETFSDTADKKRYFFLRPVWARLYSAEFIRKNRLSFREDIHTVEDYVYSVVALEAASRVSVITSVHYIYRQDIPTQITRKMKSAATVKMFFKAMDAAESALKDKNAYEDYKELFDFELAELIAGRPRGASFLSKSDASTIREILAGLSGRLMSLTFKDKDWVNPSFAKKYERFKFFLKNGMGPAYVKSTRLTRNLIFQPLKLKELR